MFKSSVHALLILSLFSCKRGKETIKPSTESITESIYASGIVKSRNQYSAFATVNGIVTDIYLSEGDTVMKGTPILLISNKTQKLNKENAQLAASFADVGSNQGKLNEAKLFIDLARNKMKSDSTLYFRQRNLWDKQIGSKVEMEQRELAYQNSKTAYYSSLVRHADLKRQLDFNSSQSKKNLLISSNLENDYTLKSEIDGILYSLSKSKGEIVGAQTPIAVIGDSKNFILEMQVDEYDIFKVKKGLNVIVTLDSYKGKVFEAIVTKINPMMNERTKTFLVEAEFVDRPEILYPNISFEANIIIQSKKEALLIPRNYILNDNFVVLANGEKVKVKTGLKDYQKIEIISGISQKDELIIPTE